MANIVFYYFVKGALDNEMREAPICSNDFLGDINDFIEIDGVGFIIVDYTIEENYWSDLMPENW